ncbi:twin-arginine translocase TatA/TatE family subunit [Halpernia sp.]|uniref:twin-arginine translocase TatA/TatE family subunit n=1 Tax=Halpernia sp. TaxID=2782209 RepID=UPI003A91EDF0
MITITILSLSWQHILIIALILILLFGGKKIPELMRGMGSGIKEFKDAVKEDENKKPTTEQPVNNPNPVNNTTENTNNPS